MKRKGLKEALNMAGLLEGAYVRHTKGEIVLDGKKYMASLTFTDADDDDPHMEPNTKWRLTEICEADKNKGTRNDTHNSR